MLRSPRHRSPQQHRARRAPGSIRRARQRVAPFIAGFALCFLIFGGGDDDAAVRSELARAAAEAAAQHAAEAATAAEIAERAVRGEVRGKDPYACPVRVPTSMRYWTRPVAELPGDAPAYDVEAYLTFVPDFGGLNNVRLGLENALSLARASGRVLVLPPIQPYYLLNSCKGGCEYSLADFFPALLQSQDRARVVTSAAFFLEILPRLAKSGRLPEGAWPPDDKILNAARRCVPMHVAAASCYALYDWLDRNFLALIPKTETTVVLFGEARARKALDAKEVDARVDKLRFDPPEWTLYGESAKRLWRDTVDGDALLGDRTKAIAHVRSAGWRTHGADIHHIDSAGRLLVPFYTYVVFVDHASQNLHKRLVRDLVRHADRVTCAAAAVVNWLNRQAPPVLKNADAGYSSLHERGGDFQFKGVKDPDAALRVLAPREALYVATDMKDKSAFEGVRKAGHRVLTLADVLAAASAARRNVSMPRPVSLVANDVAMTTGEAEAVARIGANEAALVDVLVASQGRTFTGTWFSTLSTHIQRIRGYAGRPDASTFFSEFKRWAACQRWEDPRRPWYMREYSTAWRDIDGRDAPAPRRGEGVYNLVQDGVDYSRDGYPETAARGPAGRAYRRDGGVGRDV